MKILKTVMYTPVSATVYLQPSWLARLFGAKTIACELERRDARKHYDEEEGPTAWRSKHTGERLYRMRWGSLLKHALEFQTSDDVKQLPLPVVRLVRSRDDAP